MRRLPPRLWRPLPWAGLAQPKTRSAAGRISFVADRRGGAREDMFSGEAEVRALPYQRSTVAAAIELVAEDCSRTLPGKVYEALAIDQAARQAGHARAHKAIDVDGRAEHPQRWPSRAAR